MKQFYVEPLRTKQGPNTVSVKIARASYPEVFLKDYPVEFTYVDANGNRVKALYKMSIRDANTQGSFIKAKLTKITLKFKSGKSACFAKIRSLKQPVEMAGQLNSLVGNTKDVVLQATQPFIDDLCIRAIVCCRNVAELYSSAVNVIRYPDKDARVEGFRYFALAAALNGAILRRKKAWAKSDRLMRKLQKQQAANDDKAVKEQVAA